MKITYLYQYFGTPNGSWSTRVYELSRRWVKEGHEVTVITAPYEKSDIKPNGFISEQWVDGIRLIVIDLGDDNRIAIWKRVYRAITFAIVCSFFNIRIKSDVVIASSGPITIGIPAIIGSWFKRRSFIFEVRDLWPDGGIEMGLIKGSIKIKISRWFEKYCYYKSRLIVTSSIGQKDHIKTRYPDLSIEVIPHATDLDLFKPVHRNTWPFDGQFKHVFYHIGSLGFIHNTKYIVDAAKWLKMKGRTDIGIIFIGEGSEKKELETMVDKYELSQIVLFWGILPKNDVSHALQFATATLFTTLNNPIQNTCSPNKLYDSFAAGIPVIQTTTGWIYSLFERTKCGINVDPTQPETMANAIIYMCDHPEITRSMSKAARHLAENEFSADLLAKKYASYF